MALSLLRSLARSTTLTVNSRSLGSIVSGGVSTSHTAKWMQKLEQFEDVNGKFKGSVGSQTAGFSTKIGVVIRSFDSPLLEYDFLGVPPSTRKIRLPESRVLYTVLRSPHIDKKSREQFQMTIKKQFLVINTERHELRKKFFWLKRQRIFGAQYEVIFSCKTRLDKAKLDGLLVDSSSKTAAIGS